MLSKILSVLPNLTKSLYESNLFGAAFPLAFFGMFRVGEITLTRHSSVEKILQLSDTYIDSDSIHLFLRYSKTDQFGNGTTITITNSPESNVCFQFLNSHLQCRSSQLGPLFCHINAKPLTSFQFSSILQKCLKFLQVDTKTFKSHSFRIGAATHLYLASIPESQIQNRGRWQSNAYKHYLRPELV